MKSLKVPALKEPLATDSIIWIQGNINYSFIHRTDDQPYLASETLKWFEEQLAKFIRVHKSAIVNPEHVFYFKHEEGKDAHVVLDNGVQLPVSRRRLKEVATKLRVTG